MHYIYSDITRSNNFYRDNDPITLLEKYGSPLYVYNESILRERCREMKQLIDYRNFVVNYSPKANSSLEILKIVKDEGLRVDAMSPGEIRVNRMAGFEPEEILYISNNVDEEEFRYAMEAGVRISVDSVSQLRLYGRLNPGGDIAIRLNPGGRGAGHHKKVVTAGKKTKFGIERQFIPEVKNVLKEYDLRLIGINQHIGSLFMNFESYLESTDSLLAVAGEFKDLEFIDLGGGFGVPYRKQEKEQRLDLSGMGEQLSRRINDWVREYGKAIEVKIEPGRYIVAECGIVLGKVNALKMNYDIKYVGTDIGFNVLIRPAMYDSHHDIEIYRKTDKSSRKMEKMRIVGNICETGDILAKDRLLPEIFEQDIIGVLDSGAYCYVMSSNYNNRLKPAEVLIGKDGRDRLIRRRDTLEDLVRSFE